MAIVLVTYDLNKAGQNYQGVHEYLKGFKYCKKLESVWLLDTEQSMATIRDKLMELTDGNDNIFVVKLRQNWASFNFGCSDWLKKPERTW